MMLASKNNTHIPGISYFHKLLSKGCTFIDKIDAFRLSTSRRLYSSVSSALCDVPASKTPVTNTYHKSGEDNQ